MGTISLNLEPDRTLEDVLQSMPASARSLLQRGFDRLGELPSHFYGEVIDRVQKGILSGGPLPVGLKPIDDLTSEQMGDLLAASSLLTMTIVIREELPERFVATAVKMQLMSDVSKPGVLRFANNVQHLAEDLRSAWERTKAVTQALPSLTKVETTVDLRFGFAENSIQYVVPLLLVHLDTDTYGQEIWFQFTKQQLEAFLLDMQKALDQLLAVEKWKQDQA
jgi:hypothetical protein